MEKKLVIAVFILMLSLYAAEGIISYEELRIDLLRTDPSPLQPGEKFDIWFDITNIQPYTINSLQVSFVNMFPFTIEDPNQSSIFMQEIKSSEKKSIKYTVKINKDINEGIYPIALQYYSNKIGAIVSKNFDLIIKASSVVISTANVKVTPEKVRPGSEFELSIDLTNAADYTITDISADLNLDGTPFATLAGGNERKIRQLAPTAKAMLTYDMIANPESELKVYKVPLLVTYYDRLGIKYSKNNTIGITVYARPEYNIDLENSEVFTKGQTGEITLSISNKGNSDIKFLNIELLPSNGYAIISNPRIYVGNLDSDDFETATYKINSKSSKPIKLDLKANYKDEYNNDFSDNISISMPLYSIYQAKNLGLAKRSYFWLEIISGIIVLIFVYKLYKIWRFERDIEKSIMILFKNTIKWFRNKLKL